MAVPEVQPRNEIRISPYIYDGVSRNGCDDATANISSVIPKDAIKRFIVVKELSSFWESDSDIKAYLELITSWVKIISKRVPPAAMTATPAAWPADVRFDAEIAVAEKTDNPDVAARIPKPNETDK